MAGSIGDQRVRILVDTGATISFITSALVPMLRPKPEVKKSELSVVLGNSETQDTDHYVEVPLTIHSCVLPKRPTHTHKHGSTNQSEINH